MRLKKRKLKHPEKEHDLITYRELQTLKLLAAGNTFSEIAIALNVSRTTIITHIENLKAKLNARNNCHAVFNACNKEII